MTTLVHLPYSPWSLKARWALRCMGIPVEERVYVPMVGVPWLRWVTRVWSGPVTVPALLPADGAPIMDSFAIVRWGALQPGCGWDPGVDDPRVREWNERSDGALEAGRARGTVSLAGDVSALRESVPPGLRRLGPLTDLLATSGASYFLRKYDLRAQASGASQALRAELGAARDALAGGDWLLERFTHADIAMAVTMQFVDPLPPELVPLGERSRAHWADPELAAAFPDLLAHRDRVVARVFGD